MSNIPNSQALIQAESVASGGPVSQGALYAMGGGINQSLTNSAKVGDIIMSGLQESAFVAQRDSTWCLCDGRSVIGSSYQSLTSQSNIPDLRAVYPRGCDNGGSALGARGLDPNGSQSVGNYVADQFGTHSHSYQQATFAGGPGGIPPGGINFLRTLSGTSTGSNGGTETAPKTTYVNFFIKINP
jgi:hypothetical protein